jgi:hypothetical protein
VPFFKVKVSLRGSVKGFGALPAGGVCFCAKAGSAQTKRAAPKATALTRAKNFFEFM